MVHVVLHTLDSNHEILSLKKSVLFRTSLYNCDIKIKINFFKYTNFVSFGVFNISIRFDFKYINVAPTLMESHFGKNYILRGSRNWTMYLPCDFNNDVIFCIKLKLSNIILHVDLFAKICHHIKVETNV